MPSRGPLPYAVAAQVRSGSAENLLVTPLMVSLSNHERSQNLPPALRLAQGEREDVNKPRRSETGGPAVPEDYPKV